MERVVGYFRVFKSETYECGQRGEAIGFLGFVSPQADCYKLILSDGTLIVEYWKYDVEERTLVQSCPILVTSQFSLNLYR